jgi:hypothetical protein
MKYTYIVIVGKYIIYLRELSKEVEQQAIGELFWHVWQRFFPEMPKVQSKSARANKLYIFQQ